MTTNPPSTRLARNTLVVLTSGVAAITFTVSFHGLDGYGYHVMRLGHLAPCVPAGVDMASLVALIATHMRRGEPLGRRAYAWLVFLTTALLSVAGNLADGVARGLPTAGLVGVASAPVVFVLVSHLAITSWRSSPPADAAAPPVPAELVQTPAVVDGGPAPSNGHRPVSRMVPIPAGAFTRLDGQSGAAQ